MADLDQNEFYWLIVEGPGPGVCFQCDPDVALQTPEFFLDWYENELFDIGDYGFQIRDNHIRLIGGSRARAHEHTRARGLSSYTYLNRNSSNRAILGNGLEIKVCPTCGGHGIEADQWESSDCGECDGWGSVASAIFLPLWLVQEGENNV